MHDTTKAIGLTEIYVRLNTFTNGLCPWCNSEVEELYISSGHSFSSLDGWFNVLPYWYRCLNPECTNPDKNSKFKAPQPYVLPYKKFGQDVWVFIIQEWERFKTSANECNKRLKYKGVLMSEECVQEIIDDYTLLKDEKINKETLEIIKKQGVMIIGCDGTPTEGGRETFWVFYDVISGRMLHAELLDGADHETLLAIFRSIESRYGVEVKGFLSDHQESIALACKAFDPNLPHQTCHFHFLRNHWDFIEKKDTHLNKQLRKVVNSLPIMQHEYNGGTYYSPDIKVKKRGFFMPLIKLLKQSVNHQTEDFDKLKGVRAYEDISTIVEYVDSEVDTLDPELRPVIQLKASRDALANVLQLTRETYEDIKELDGEFQSIRLTLEDKEKSKAEIKRVLNTMYGELWKKCKRDAGYSTLNELKTVPAQYSLENPVIFCQWRRLWDSHVQDLFHHHDVEGMERTNIYNEQIYSLLKRQATKTSGKSHGMYMVFTRGQYRVADITTKNSFTIHEVLSRYDLKHLKVLREPLNARKEEALSWYGSSTIDKDIITDFCDSIRNREWEDE